MRRQCRLLLLHRSTAYYELQPPQGGKVSVIGLRDQPLAIFRLLRLDRVLGD